MALVYERCVGERITIIPDPDAVPFVAKLQKAKTRKDKEYFIFRTTIPKTIAEKIGVKAGGFVFFKAKKAQWYHMLDWEKMENTWAMLPQDVRNKVIIDGLCNQKIMSQAELGATNLSALPPQIISIPTDQSGETQWK